jgi:hypothetical protein
VTGKQSEAFNQGQVHLKLDTQDEPKGMAAFMIHQARRCIKIREDAAEAKKKLFKDISFQD